MNKLNLNDIEKKVHLFLISKDIKSMSALQIAEQLYVSRTTVYRVCHKMGYKSFTHFKYMNEQNKKINSLKVLNNENLLDSADETYVNTNELLTIIEEITRANHVYVFGTHATGIGSQYLTRQLINLGILAIQIHDEFELSQIIKHITKEDVIIFLSNSGSNIIINKNIGNINATKIGLTKKNSKLEKMCNYNITFDFSLYKGDNSFDRENIFTLIIIIQKLLINIKDILKGEEDE